MNGMTGDVLNEVQRAMNRCADCGTLAQEIRLSVSGHCAARVLRRRTVPR